MKIKKVKYAMLSFEDNGVDVEYPVYAWYEGNNGRTYTLDIIGEYLEEMYGLTVLSYPGGIKLPIVTNKDTDLPIFQSVEGEETQFKDEEEMNEIVANLQAIVEFSPEEFDDNEWDVTTLFIMDDQSSTDEQPLDEQPSTNEQPTDEQPSTDEQSPTDEQPSTEEQSQEEQALDNQSPTEEQSTNQPVPPEIDMSLLDAYNNIEVPEESVKPKTPIPVPKPQVPVPPASALLRNMGYGLETIAPPEGELNYVLNTGVEVNKEEVEYVSQQESQQTEEPPQVEELPLDQIDTDIEVPQEETHSEEPISSEETHSEEPISSEETQSEEPVQSQDTSSQLPTVVEDHPLTDATEESVSEQYEAISASQEDYKTEFIPRAMWRKDYLYNLNDELLEEAYYLITHNQPNTTIPQQSINDIRNHFGNCDYSIRVLFDAFTLDELKGILHIEVLDESPNLLYEGLFKAIYLFVLFCREKGYDDKRIGVTSGIKLINLATSTQQAIAVEESVDDEDDDLTQGSVQLISDIVGDSCEKLGEFISDSLFKTSIQTEEGEKLRYLDSIKYLCWSSITDKYISLSSTKFAEIAKLDNLTLQFKENAVHMYNGCSAVFPNAIGILYGIYTNNIRTYINSNLDIDVQIKDIPVKDLDKGIDYNKVLERIKTDTNFKKFRNLTQFEPLNDIANMNLKIVKEIFPKVGEVYCRKCLGYICKNEGDLDPNRTYFIPVIGSFLLNMDTLNIKFTQPITIKPINKAGVHTAAFDFNTFRKEYIMNHRDEVKVIALQMNDIINNITMSELQKLFLQNIELQSTKIPDFVKNAEESILFGYYNLLKINQTSNNK